MKIEKGVPIPEVHKITSDVSELLIQMEVGDSFAKPAGGQGKQVIQNRMKCTARYYEKKLGVKFITRTVSEGGMNKIRVWRVE